MSTSSLRARAGAAPTISTNANLETAGVIGLQAARSVSAQKQPSHFCFVHMTFVSNLLQLNYVHFRTVWVRRDVGGIHYSKIPLWFVLWKKTCGGKAKPLYGSKIVSFLSKETSELCNFGVKSKIIGEMTWFIAAKLSYSDFTKE